MSDLIDYIISDVLEQAGRDFRDDIRSRLDNDYPPSSSPGESPHRRSGGLQDGIAYAVERFGATYTLTVSSTAPHSRFLEEGTDRMAARPFMGPAFEVWAPIIAARLDSAFSGSSPVMAAA